MTQEFHIKGIIGLLLFIGACIAAIICMMVIPSGFLMVLWNATVFEGFGGPQADWLQGGLLWLSGLILLKILVKPCLEFSFRRATPQELAALQSFVESYSPENALLEHHKTKHDSLSEQIVEVSVQEKKSSLKN